VYWYHKPYKITVIATDWLKVCKTVIAADWSNMYAKKCNGALIVR